MPNLGATRIFTALTRIISICGNISFHWFHLHKMAGECFSLISNIFLKKMEKCKKDVNFRGFTTSVVGKKMQKEKPKEL